MWEVVFHPAADEERLALPRAERVAIANVVEKLRAMGPDLPFPHQSAVRGAAGLRELRPRAGRSAWRALFARIENTFLVAAIGPEAQADPRGFARAVIVATERLRETEEDKS